MLLVSLALGAFTYGLSSKSLRLDSILNVVIVTQAGYGKTLVASS